MDKINFSFEEQATDAPAARGLGPQLGLPFDQMKVGSKLSINVKDADPKQVRAELLRHQRAEGNEDAVFVTRTEEKDGETYFSIWRNADVPRAQRPTRKSKPKGDKPTTEATAAKAAAPAKGTGGKK